MCNQEILTCGVCGRPKQDEPIRDIPCPTGCGKLERTVFVQAPTPHPECENRRLLGHDGRPMARGRTPAPSFPAGLLNPADSPGTTPEAETRGRLQGRSHGGSIESRSQGFTTINRSTSPAQQQRSNLSSRQRSTDEYLPPLPVMRSSTPSSTDPTRRGSPLQGPVRPRSTTAEPSLMSHQPRGTVEHPPLPYQPGSMPVPPPPLPYQPGGSMSVPPPPPPGFGAPHQPTRGGPYESTSYGTVRPLGGFADSATRPSQQSTGQVGSIVANNSQAQSIITLPPVSDIVDPANNSELPKDFAPRLDSLPMLPPRLNPLGPYTPLQPGFLNAGAPHPLKAQLATLGYIEPEEWERWRTNPGYGQYSRNARYQHARTQLPDWYLPLPYEPERYYIDRQAALGQTNRGLFRSHHWWREYFDRTLRHANRMRENRERMQRRSKAKQGNKGDSVTDPLSGFDPKTSNSWRGGHDGGRGGHGGGGDRGGPGGAAGGFISAGG